MLTFKSIFPKSIFSIAGILLLSACGQQTNKNHDLITPDKNAAAHWLTPEIILVNNTNNIDKLELVSSSSSGNKTINALSKINLPVELRHKYPHLSSFVAYKIDSNIDTKTRLKKQNQINQYQNGELVIESRVQTYGVLDALYTQGNNDADEIQDYGATLVESGTQFKLWAPTASKVEVIVFDTDKQEIASLAMQEDQKTGVWQLVTSQANAFDFYQYKLDVFHPATGKFETLITTDPYSLSLSTNSKYSQIINLSDPVTFPKDWLNQTIPTVDDPEDLILYETHVRDFSAVEKQLSDQAYRGKYKAFTDTNSDGMKHLNKLGQAGLNTIHLLPVYDLSTINEAPNTALSLDDPLSKACDIHSQLSYCSDESLKQLSIAQLLQQFDSRTNEAEALIETIRADDDYNWGYDPYHYTVPEGSYAVNPEAHHRILEFREMILSLHNKGFRVIMDVVYNHTFESGVGEKSVLDKVVPGYYHRYNIISGDMERSTCCDNSATEHAMMEKLMIDSLLVWTNDYKIDGFRFDLMGHQPKAAMLRARDAVLEIDPDNYFYGEGWNFGEVANNAQFIQATQNELSGTEIGTFTDRMRDAIRGGAPFVGGKDIRKGQGITNGLYVIPNELQSTDKDIEEYYLSMDQVRIGLAGNLKSFPLLNAKSEMVTGQSIPYGGDNTGYAEDPADTINYVSKHDNQSLWDNNQYRIPYHVSSDDRVRMQNLSLAYPLMSQGIPFLHMGSELLRSKSFLRDSYDYGDWFNAVDFSYQSNNYDVGLPPKAKDEENWPVIKELLEKNEGRDKVNASQIKFAADVFADFIKIRSQSKLFRLTSTEQINQRVTFHNTGKEQQLGVIVMSLSDQVGDDLDANYESIVVVFNNDDEHKNVDFDSRGYELHPVQAQGVDKKTKMSIVTESGFTVSALSAAVFVKR